MPALVDVADIDLHLGGKRVTGGGCELDAGHGVIWVWKASIMTWAMAYGCHAGLDPASMHAVNGMPRSKQCKFTPLGDAELT